MFYFFNKNNTLTTVLYRSTVHWNSIELALDYCKYQYFYGYNKKTINID